VSFFDLVVSISPHRVRRELYRSARFGEFDYLESFRRIENKAGYCLRPFDENEVIFVHVPKAAGTSVSRSLFGSLGGGHTKMSEYQVVFSPSELRRYFKFTFVRNPWDRLHSAYHFLRNGGASQRDREFARTLEDFGSFDEFVCRWVNEKNVETFVHFEPQNRFICLPGRRKPAVDFVGRFENLAEDYEAIRARVASAQPLLHVNKTDDRPDFREEYSDKARAIVARVYRRDIEMLGYAFENIARSC
jgi:hypothetical protein